MNTDDSEIRKRQFAEQTNSGVRMGLWSRDLHAERVEWSVELEEIFGLRQGEFAGTQAAFHELVHPDDLPRLERAIKDSLRDGSEYCVLFRFKHRNGQWRWMEGRGLPTFDDAGKPIRLDGIGIDVTERTMSENFRFRLAAIVESSDDAILSKTLEGIITSWNAGATRIFGYVADEMIGTSVTRLIPTELLREEDEILSKIRSGQRVEHYETRRRAKDGSLVDVSLTVSPVRDSTGAIIGASKIARDIGALRRAAEERETLLASERAARSEAEKLGHLKDEFLATLSHELRTPLNAIIGWASVLLRKPGLAGQELTTAIQTIDRNARLQAQIIDDLLDMSRIIAGKIHLETEYLPVQDVLELAVEAIRPALIAKRITLETSWDAAAGAVRGDPARIQQVLWNLLTNAVKFTPQDGVVRVGLRRAGTFVEIVVADSGIGIEADFLPYVFDRFRQADGSTTRRHGGLGLGLSIVRNLVELHGGTVGVQSAGKGTGTTFTVTLPATASRKFAARAASASSLSAVADLLLPRLTDAVILAVDDDADARNLLQRLLEEAGAHVITASSAEEALAVLESRKVDAMLSDIGMPGLGGYELIRRIRSSGNQQVRSTPALALTAYARAEDRKHSLDAGFHAHLSKPYSAVELLTRLQQIVAGVER